jgi:hypothetical protein
MIAPLAQQNRATNWATGNPHPVAQPAGRLAGQVPQLVSQQAQHPRQDLARQTTARLTVGGRISGGQVGLAARRQLSQQVGHGGAQRFGRIEHL